MKLVKKFKNNFFGSDESEPLSKFILLLIIILDIFVFSSIFQGLKTHSRQLDKIDEYTPYWCVRLINDKIYNKTIDRYIVNYRTVFDTKKWSARFVRHEMVNTPITDKTHYRCVEYNEYLINFAKNNPDVIRHIQNKNHMKDEFNKLKKEIERLSVPNIAPNQVESHITNKINEKYAKLNSMEQDIEYLLESEKSLLEYQAFKKEWRKLIVANKSEIEEFISSFNFWRPLKKLTFEMVFLLPLIIVFYFWYVVSSRKKRSLQKILALHMLVVASIPIFLELFVLIYKIIPNTILKSLFIFLKKLKLIGFYYYISIAITIGVAFLAIKYLHKKFFSKSRIIAKRINKSRCIYCSSKLPKHNLVKHCFDCGKEQKSIQCNNCNEKTYPHFNNCINCGALIKGVDKLQQQ